MISNHHANFRSGSCSALRTQQYHINQVTLTTQPAAAVTVQAPAIYAGTVAYQPTLPSTPWLAPPSTTTQGGALVGAVELPGRNDRITRAPAIAAEQPRLDARAKTNLGIHFGTCGKQRKPWVISLGEEDIPQHELMQHRAKRSRSATMANRRWTASAVSAPIRIDPSMTASEPIQIDPRIERIATSVFSAPRVERRAMSVPRLAEAEHTIENIAKDDKLIKANCIVENKASISTVEGAILEIPKIVEEEVSHRDKRITEKLVDASKIEASLLGVRVAEGHVAEKVDETIKRDAINMPKTIAVDRPVDMPHSARVNRTGGYQYHCESYLNRDSATVDTKPSTSSCAFRDLHEFWGSKEAKQMNGFAGGAFVSSGRLSLNEAQATLQRMANAHTANLDEIRRLRKEINEWDALKQSASLDQS